MKSGKVISPEGGIMLPIAAFFDLISFTWITNFFAALIIGGWVVTRYLASKMLRSEDEETEEDENEERRREEEERKKQEEEERKRKEEEEKRRKEEEEKKRREEEEKKRENKNREDKNRNTSNNAAGESKKEGEKEAPKSNKEEGSKMKDFGNAFKNDDKAQMIDSKPIDKKPTNLRELAKYRKPGGRFSLDIKGRIRRFVLSWLIKLIPVIGGFWPAWTIFVWKELKSR